MSAEDLTPTNFSYKTSKGFEVSFNMERRALEFAKQVISSQNFVEAEITSFFFRSLKSGDVTIDIGANAGLLSRIAAMLVGAKGKVIAVEPGTNILPTLTANLEAMPYKNWEIIPFPLKDKNEPTEFFINSDNSGGNAIWDPAQWATNEKSQQNKISYMIESKTLDDIAMPYKERGIKMIKIDTEGAEELILRGGKRTLAEIRPNYIIAECHGFGLNLLNSSFRSLRNFMMAYGYSTYVLPQSGSLPIFIPFNTEVNFKFISNVLFTTEENLSKVFPSVNIDISLY